VLCIRDVQAHIFAAGCAAAARHLLRLLLLQLPCFFCSSRWLQAILMEHKPQQLQQLHWWRLWSAAELTSRPFAASSNQP